MFKRLLKSLEKFNYIVTIEDGQCVVKEKDNQKEYSAFSVKEKNKGKLLLNCYLDLLAKK
jgi:hypothetical protein